MQNRETQQQPRQQQHQAGGRDPQAMKGKKGSGQGGQSGKTQNGQNMQKRDGRH